MEEKVAQYFQDLSQCTDEEFIAEINSSQNNEIKLSNAQQYFQILTTRLNLAPTNLLALSILKNIYQLISTEKKLLKIYSQNHFFKSLPYNKKIYNRYILDILYYVVNKYPESIIDGFDRQMEELIPYEGKKTLMLLSMYVEQSDVLNTLQTKILKLLIKDKCCERFSLFDLASEYALLLSFVVGKSESFRESEIERAWEIVNNILENTDDIGIIYNCYKALTRIECYYQREDFNYKLVLEHLNNPSLVEVILPFLFFVPFNKQPIMKNESFIRKLLKLSEEYGFIILKLIDIARKSEIALDYLSKNKKWLSVGHQFMKDTISLFLVVYKQRGDEMVLDKEFAKMLINFADETDSHLIVKVIATLFFKVRLNKEVLDELTNDESDFFPNLIEKAKEKNTQIYCYYCVLIAFAISKIESNSVILDFCIFFKNGLSFKPDSRDKSSSKLSKGYFKDICFIGTLMSQSFPEMKQQFIKIGLPEMLNNMLTEEHDVTIQGGIKAFKNALN